MKKTFTIGLSMCLLAFTGLAQARDTRLLLPINQAMQSKEAEQVIDPNIKVQFAGGGKGAVVRAGVVTSRKTNSFGKTDESACQWAFLSGIKQLQQKAHQLGASKVINVVSYYDKKTISSRTEYECHAGGVIAGVALKGDLVK